MREHNQSRTSVLVLLACAIVALKVVLGDVSSQDKGWLHFHVVSDFHVIQCKIIRNHLVLN